MCFACPHAKSQTLPDLLCRKARRDKQAEQSNIKSWVSQPSRLHIQFTHTLQCTRVLPRLQNKHLDAQYTHRLLSYHNKGCPVRQPLSCTVNGLLKLITKVEVVYKRSYKVCTENKQCNQNLNNQVGCWLLCKKIIHAIDAPAEKYDTN